MIKGLYSTSYGISDGIKNEYTEVLESCKMYLRSKSEMTRGLEGKDFNNKIKELIMTFVEEKKVYTEDVVDGEKVNKDRLVSKLYGDINQYGPITEFLVNPDITDIYVEGVGPGNLYVMKGRTKIDAVGHNGELLYFKTPEEIEGVINKLAFSSKVRLNTAHPILYSQTIHGFRLTANDKSMSSNVIMPDGTKLQTPTFSIRIGSKENLSLNDMVYKFKSIHPEVAKALSVIGRLEHIKILFSGTPGTGKTTLMEELVKTIMDKRILTLERTPELKLWQYDEKGVIKNTVKSLIAHKDKDASGNMSTATIRNLYLMSLREKVDILILGEIRGGEEISVMLEAAVAGQGVMSSIHGEDEETTIERLVKDISREKNASRSEAMEEAYLSVNIIINMMIDSVDQKIRIRSISEVIKEETSNGVRVNTNRLFDFDKYKRGINPETGAVYGNYRKVGVPSQRLQRYIRDTNLTEEDEKVLMDMASYENPIVYSEDW